MATHAFDRPLTVACRRGFPRSIASVNGAVRFLEDYPRLLQDEAYQATRDACFAALYGDAPSDEAYDVFMAFARRRGILVDDPLVVGNGATDLHA